MFVTEPVTDDMSFFFNGRPLTIPEAGWYDFGDGVPRKLTDAEARERGLP